MARSKDPYEGVPKLGEVRGDYERAVERYMLKAGMLSISVQNALQLTQRIREMDKGEGMNEALREALEKALREFEAA